DKSVLFPEPDGPIIAMNSPGLTVRDTFLSASTVESPSLNDFVTFFSTKPVIYSTLPIAVKGSIFVTWRAEITEPKTDTINNTIAYKITILKSKLNGIPSGKTRAVKYVNTMPAIMLISDNKNTCEIIDFLIKLSDAPIAFMTPNCCVFCKMNT